MQSNSMTFEPPKKQKPKTQKRVTIHFFNEVFYILMADLNFEKHIYTEKRLDF